MSAKPPITSKPKKYSKNVITVSAVGLLFCALGIIDAIYLTITHYNAKIILACPSTGIINCEKVTTSSYSVVFGIPAPILGLIFFTGMLVFQLPQLWASQNVKIRLARMAYSVVGLLTVFWFVFVEFHKLNAICLYCTAVHILTFGLFVTTLVGMAIINSSSKEDIESK